MAAKETKKYEPPVIKPGTPEMEHLLSAGYGGMTVAEAKEIVEGRAKNPAMFSYEQLKQAQAFLAAYNTAPVAISTDKGWRRDRPQE
jgi:hypothetical protein